MNKIQDPAKLLAAISIIPESAPFSTEQRAWLNGFFAGMTGLEQIYDNVESDVSPRESDPIEEEDFPWHDENLEIQERMQLAEGKPQSHKLMSAMAQLDCGSCGYVCQTYAEAIASGEEDNLTLCSPGGKETARAIRKLVKLGGGPAPSAIANADTEGPANSAWSRKNPFSARLISSTKLTGEQSAKDVRHVEIDLTGSDLEYNCGDSLGVYPTNCNELIESIVEACQPSANNQPADLLTKDLSAVTDELAEWFIANLPNVNQRKHAEAIAADEELLDEKDVLDFLQLFPSIRISIPALLTCLPNLNPRLYSIASSLEKHPNQVHLTVGKVTYEQTGRRRKGVTSTMLAERIKTGSHVSVFVQPSHGFSVPSDQTAPMIMIGPGTGIAPFISFLQQRDASHSTGDNWLFFGDQKSETDFLYRQELEDYLSRGVLNRLDTAFSRDQDHKVYVQDRMREQGAEIFRWLEAGSSFYVCGDASRMAKDVDSVLHEIISQHGNVSSDEARQYINKLSSEARYSRDVY